MSYESALNAAGATVLKFEYFGSYQGDWWAKVELNGKTGWINGSFGSCTVCDAYQSWESEKCGWDREPTPDELKAFGADYLDGFMEQEAAILKASKDLEWDMEAESVVKFLNENA